MDAERLQPWVQTVAFRTPTARATPPPRAPWPPELVGRLDAMGRAAKEGHGHLLPAPLGGKILNLLADPPGSLGQLPVGLVLHDLDDCSGDPVADLPGDESVKCGLEIVEVRGRFEAARSEEVLDEPRQVPGHILDRLSHGVGEVRPLHHTKQRGAVADERING